MLALGVFERVGSNWFVDSLRPRGVVHNEPARQQFHPTHPLSVLNPAPLELHDLDAWRWEPYGWHWLVSFVVSKYGTPSHIVKETNLFFAADRLLGLFPDAPIVVLSRTPAGIASSFARGRLFNRWGYRARYELLAAAVARPDLAGYRAVLPDDRPDELRMLTRMVVLNALVLATALDTRRYAHVAYEQALVDQAAAINTAADILGPRRFALAHDAAPAAAPTATVDDTYDTRQVGTRDLLLDPDEIGIVRQEVEARLVAAAGELPTGAVDRAGRWLSADPGPARSGARRPGAGTKRSAASTAPQRAVLRIGASVEARYTRRTATPALLWRTTLVTNGEFRAFLDDLRHAGMPNLVDATALFCNDAMPHERGGRIHPAPDGERHLVSPGYEIHPVYWVTWIGAAAFARWAGARLPTRDELDRLVTATEVDLATVNADYRIGDVTPVSDDVPIGNLQVWCQDGPTLPGGGLARRYLYGAAWNTPATWAEIRRLRYRHITGCSRGVGIQLVATAHSVGRPRPARLIAQDLRRSLGRLADRSRSLADLDDELIRALAGRDGCG